MEIISVERRIVRNEVRLPLTGKNVAGDMTKALSIIQERFHRAWGDTAHFPAHVHFEAKDNEIVFFFEVDETEKYSNHERILFQEEERLENLAKIVNRGPTNFSNPDVIEELGKSLISIRNRIREVASEL